MWCIFNVIIIKSYIKIVVLEVENDVKSFPNSKGLKIICKNQKNVTLEKHMIFGID